MPKKNREEYLEYILTFLLLFSSWGLLAGALSSFGLYLFVALAIGQIIGWYNPGVNPLWAKVSSVVAVVGILVWTVYSLLNSTFAYQEVVFLCIKGAFLLEVVLIANSALPGYLNYVQLLSVPLFMAFPLFSLHLGPVQIILLAVYLMIWVGLLRLKFNREFLPEEEFDFLDRVHIVPVVFFLSAIALAWFLYCAISFSANKEGGFLKERGILLTIDALEKEYYDSRDQVQEKVTSFTLRLPTDSNRRNSLSLLGSLVNEDAPTIEVDKAAEGLVSLQRTLGSGLNSGDAPMLTIALNKLVDKKIEFNIRKATTRMKEVIKENPFNLLMRLSAAVQVGQLEQADTLGALQKDKAGFQSTISHAALGETSKKEELAMMRQVENWKVLELYREKMKKLKGRLEIFTGSLQDALGKAYDELKDADSPSALAAAKEGAFKLAALPITAAKEFSSGLYEAAQLKEMMLVEQASEEIGAALQQAYLKTHTLNELKELVAIAQYTDSLSQLVDTYWTVKNSFTQNRVDVLTKLDSLVAMRSEIFLGNVKETVRQITAKDLPESLVASITADLSAIARAGDPSERLAASNKAQESLEQLRSSDFISSSLAEDMRRILEDVMRLAELRAYLQNPNARESALGASSGILEDGQRQAGQAVLVKKLVRLKIAPALLVVPSGKDAAIRAIGIYSDNSQEELTYQVRWKVVDAKYAEIVKGRVYGYKAGDARGYARYEGVLSLPVTIKVTDPVLTAIALRPKLAAIGMDDTLTLQAEGYYSDATHHDISAFVTWKVVGKNILKQEGGYFKPVAFGQTHLRAAYLGITSMPVQVSVVITFLWILKRIVLAILVLLAIMAVALWVLYFLTRKNAHKIAALCASDPHSFIILLYEHSLAFFRISGRMNKDNLPPLTYACSLQEILGTDKDIFVQFTRTYEEAKYSQHPLVKEDAEAAKGLYNEMVAGLLRKEKGLKRTFIYCRGLFQRRPFSIPTMSIAK